MSEDKSLEFKKEFEKLRTEARTLEELFSVWKRAHALEVEEWKHKSPKGEDEKEKPRTVPVAFLKKFPDVKIREEAMKNSFCGDGYIGTSQSTKETYNNKNNSNNEPNKFTRFLILKEENHIQKRKDWETGISPYNTYYGDWVYTGTVKDENGKTVSAPATRLGNIVAGCVENWKKDMKKSDIQELMEKCAIINVNKRGGGSSSDKSLSQYFKKYESFFLKEIDLLRADGEPLEFFVFGSGISYYTCMKDILEPNSFGVNCKVYNLSHPARQMSYDDRKKEWDERKNV